MPIITRHLGDEGGLGHDIIIHHQDDGITVLQSHNPDTEEIQSIVLMENQWRMLLRVLLEVYGKDKCCYFRSNGKCADTPEALPMIA